MYHVLGGVINPMANVQPSDLNIAKLIERLKDSEVKEVILALNPNVEGEATTSFLSQLLEPDRHQGDAPCQRPAGGRRPRIRRRDHLAVRSPAVAPSERVPNVPHVGRGWT